MAIDFPYECEFSIDAFYETEGWYATWRDRYPEGHTENYGSAYDKWCHANLGYIPPTFYIMAGNLTKVSRDDQVVSCFKNEEDATLFKLKWAS
jgi:hypothetical protein